MDGGGGIVKDGTIIIEFGPLKNERDGFGFVPMLWVNGRQQWSTWAARFMGEDEATVAAHELAREEAARFVGDWDITVKAREVASWT
jgi:hypothetical protein